MEDQTNNNQPRKEEDAEIIKKEVLKQSKNDTFKSEKLWDLFNGNLDLSGRSLKDIRIIKYLKNISALYLKNNEIENIWSLACLIKLTELDLSNNKIDDIGALEKLAELKALDLSGNEISDISPLFELYKLECLDIRNCKNITPEQVKKLETELPNCKVIFRTQ